MRKKQNGLKNLIYLMMINKTIFLLLPFFIFSQNVKENIASKKFLFDGNTYFENQQFNTAEYNYRKSYSKDSLNPTATYNLGNSLYKNNLSPEARFNYTQSIKKLSDKESLHRAYHNLGNTYMQEENYQGAVDAFKRSLINNPNDEETRFNYVLAKELLKNQNNNQNQNDKKDNKDNKDNKDDQQKKDDKSDPQNKKNDDQKNKADSKEKQKKPEISPQQLKNILEAMNKEEKKVQEKVNKKKMKGSPKKSNKKDW